MKRTNVVYAYSFFLFSSIILLSCVGKNIIGNVSGQTYIGKTEINLNANSSIMIGQGYEYGYILEHVWKISKENPNITKADINLIIHGDDGYGNKKSANWTHLIFDEYQLLELRKYSDLSKMSWSDKADLLDLVGMAKLKDYKGDLNPDVFGNN
jgi:hypothetical protein